MKFKLILIFNLFYFFSFSQSGSNSFAFLNFETSSRSLSMGGNLISIYDNDITLSQKTPSLINTSMDNDLSFSFVDYFSDITVASFNYSKTLNQIGSLSFGVVSANYGDFVSSNENGEAGLDFSAKDQIFSVAFARQINSVINLGFNINLLNSTYERYHASAISSNISTTYYNNENNFHSTLLFKNIGRPVNGYEISNEKIPFEILFGISKKLEYLPFRYSLVYNHLNRFDISNDYNLNSFTNNQSGELEFTEESFAKTFLRHIIVSGELSLFNNNLYVRGGFNFQRRFNMTIDTYGGLVGFSFGLAMNVSKIQINYSRSSYNLAGQLNSFSISTNLSTFGI